MPARLKRNSKPLYYSISDVARMIDLKPYVLRYWETEFRQLRPMKNRSGSRAYRQKDIDLLKLIKKLLYEDGYTIAGARNRLREVLKSGSDQLSLKLDGETRKQYFQDIKKDLKEVIEMLRGEG
jgi:DNA-binding transcriptional MerR regulator